jgi:hypothetical protein
MTVSRHPHLFRRLAAAGALIGALAAAASACAAEISYSGSAQFATGEYVFTERTNALYLFTGITVHEQPFQFSANIPLIIQNTPWITYAGSGLLPSGAGQHSDTDTRGRIDLADSYDTPEIGLGDPLIRCDVELFPMKGARPSIELVGSVKVPIADVDRGFGTGEWDFGSGLSMAASTMGFFLFAEGMYWILGDMPELELENVLSYGFSIGRPFARGKMGLLASLLGYTETIENIDPPLQAGLGFNYLTDSGTSVNASCTAGLTDSAPDLSISIGWMVPLKK